MTSQSRLVKEIGLTYNVASGTAILLQGTNLAMGFTKYIYIKRRAKVTLGIEFIVLLKLVIILHLGVFQKLIGLCEGYRLINTHLNSYC